MIRDVIIDIEAKSNYQNTIGYGILQPQLLYYNIIGLHIDL
jgi:hypothetical protein